MARMIPSKNNHSGCRYFYTCETTESKNTYSGLHGHNIDVEYKITTLKCGLNPASVKLDNEQVLCQNYEEVK